MKRIFCLLIGFGLILTLIEGEEMMNKNAGRIIGLKELMRITDEEGDFYFKRPDNIQIAPDGSIFLTDEDQFLRFDKTGRFLKNLQKTGEGPGEYSYIFNYGFSDGNIIVYTGQPSKIIETDMTGKLLKENRIEQYMSFTRVLGFYEKGYWFVGSTFMDTGKKKSGLITVNLELCWGNPAGKIKKVGISFPEKWYLIKKTVGKAMQVQMTILVPAIFAMDQTGNLYASNTQKYNIQRVNLKKGGEIIGKFGREYSPVRYRVEKSSKKKIKPLVQPPKFFNDIQKLIIHHDYLWVLTSTVEKGKGVLVDVFTKEGNYIDNFYLPLPQLEKVNDIPRKPICLYKDFLFTVATENDQPVLIKYLIDLKL